MTSVAQIRQRSECDQGPPRQVLVIAGNLRQFKMWQWTQHPDRVRRAVYIATPDQARGYGPQHVEAVVLTGEWWLNRVYRSESEWRPLVRLAETVGEGRTGWLSWAGQTQQERALMAIHEEQGGLGEHNTGSAQVESSVRLRVEGEIEMARDAVTRSSGPVRSRSLGDVASGR